MSDYERVKGVLTRIDVSDYECFAKHMLICKGENLDSKPQFYDTYVEWLLDMYDNEIVELNGTLYWIEKLDKEYDPPTDFCNITKINNYTFSFDTMFYNSGTCWTEMVEYEIKRQESV